MRRRMTAKDMRDNAGWQIGEHGEKVADLFVALNELVFQKDCKPVPITFPATLPYGGCIGQTWHGCSGDAFQYIQLKREDTNGEGRKHVKLYEMDAAGRKATLQFHADTLVHEMLHLYLFQGQRPAGHDNENWCAEIMRISRLLWDQDIWAAPIKVGKVVEGHKDGKQIRKSVRLQAESADGKASAPMGAIARWPDSFNLHVPVDAILDGTFKVHKPKTVAKKKATPAKKRVRQITKPKTAPKKAATPALPPLAKHHQYQPRKVVAFLRTLKWNKEYTYDVFSKAGLPRLADWGHGWNGEDYKKGTGVDIVRYVFHFTGADAFYPDDDYAKDGGMSLMIEGIAKHFRSKWWKGKVERSKNPKPVTGPRRRKRNV